MSASQIILLASLKPELVRALQVSISRWENLRFGEAINPRSPELIEAVATTGDVALIEADDLIWLWEHQAEATWAALRKVRTIVLLAERQLLDVATRARPVHGLVLHESDDDVPAGRLMVAIEGYTALPRMLLRRLTANQARLDMVRTLSPDERQILAYLSAALSNRQIAEASGMAEARVKTLVHMLTRKLRLTNRTALAVFAATNGLVNPA